MFLDKLLSCVQVDQKFCGRSKLWRWNFAFEVLEDSQKNIPLAYLHHKLNFEPSIDFAPISHRKEALIVTISIIGIHFEFKLRSRVFPFSRQFFFEFQLLLRFTFIMKQIENINWKVSEPPIHWTISKVSRYVETWLILTNIFWYVRKNKYVSGVERDGTLRYGHSV